MCFVFKELWRHFRILNCSANNNWIVAFQMSEIDYEVSSELYQEYDYVCKHSKPTLDNNSMYSFLITKIICCSLINEYCFRRNFEISIHTSPGTLYYWWGRRPCCAAKRDPNHTNRWALYCYINYALVVLILCILEHSKSTVLGLVGLQIWRGALLLADWIICNRKTFTETSVVLELGAGVGLTSIVAAMYCPVICTGTKI